MVYANATSDKILPYRLLACLVGMILPMGHHSTNRTAVVTSRPRNIRIGGHLVTHPFPTDVYYLGNVIREDYMQVRPFLFPPNIPCRQINPEIRRFRIHGTTHDGYGSNDPTKRP